MRQMKDSGIEWIGEIPESWSVSKLKFFVDCYDGKRVPIDSAKRKDGIYPYWGAGSITDYVDDYIFDEELVLLGEDGAPFFDHTRPVAFLVNEKIWVNNHIHVLKVHETMSSNYIVHFLNNVDYKTYINGSILNKLTQSNMNEIVMLIPPLPEQHLISAYLDRQCTLIDSVIEKTKASIEEYKKLRQAVITQAVTKGVRGDRAMKDSGIEWIGEIPESWDIVATKRLFQIISGATPKSENPDFFDGEIAWITPADYKTDDVYVSGGRRNITDLGLKSCNTSLIPSESIIFSKRAPIGSVAINKVKLCTNQGCLACVPQIELSIKFYYYFMAVYSEQYNLLGSGTTFKEISVTCFSDFKLTFPPLPEQQEIAAYLDQKCAEIDSLITQKEQFITELDSYKKSLIYEYVTGKKEVPQA